MIKSWEVVLKSRVGNDIYLWPISTDFPEKDFIHIKITCTVLCFCSLTVWRDLANRSAAPRNVRSRVIVFHIESRRVDEFHAQVEFFGYTTQGELLRTTTQVELSNWRVPQQNNVEFFGSTNQVELSSPTINQRRVLWFHQSSRVTKSTNSTSKTSYQVDEFHNQVESASSTIQIELSSCWEQQILCNSTSWVPQVEFLKSSSTSRVTQVDFHGVLRPIRLAQSELSSIVSPILIWVLYNCNIEFFCNNSRSSSSIFRIEFLKLLDL